MDNILKTVGIFNEMFMKEVEKVINNDNNNKETLGEKIHNAIREDIKNEKIIQELEEEKAVLNNSNISLQEEIRRLEMSYKEAGNVIDNLRNEKNKLSNTITYLKNTLNDKTFQEKDLNDIITHGTAENKSLTKRNGDLVDNSTRLFNENVELKKTLEAKIKHEQNLMSKCNEAVGTVFNLKQQLNDLNKNTDNLKIIELQTTVGSLKIQLTESLSNLMKWKNEVKNKDWELKEIQHSLDLHKKADRELREQIIKLKEKNNNLHKKLNDLISQNNEINIVKEKATEVLYKKSSEIFGNKHIFEQIIEEMAELMVEINKVRRVNEDFDLTKTNNLPQIMEEVCDVQMCLNHLKILFNETDFKNVQVKKFDKFIDHFKRQFNKKENEKKLNDLTNNPEIKDHVFFPLVNEDQLFAESVSGCL